MKVFRYELVFDEIPQNVGFLTGIESTDLSISQKKYYIDYFDKYLTIPNKSFFKNNTISYFKQEGVIKFTIPLLKLINDLNKYNWNLTRINFEINDKDILYEDDYQVIIKKDY